MGIVTRARVRFRKRWCSPAKASIPYLRGSQNLDLIDDEHGVLLRLVKRILDRDCYTLSPRLDHLSPFSSRGSRVESLSATGNLCATLTKKPRKITGRSMGRLPTPCENVSVFDLPDEVPGGPMAMIGVIVGEVTTAQAELGFIIMMFMIGVIRHPELLHRNSWLKQHPEDIQTQEQFDKALPQPDRSLTPAR